jgi:hypothetical protein
LTRCCDTAGAKGKSIGSIFAMQVRNGAWQCFNPYPVMFSDFSVLLRRIEPMPRTATSVKQTKPARRWWGAAVLAGVALSIVALSARAWTLNITAAPRRVYLQVGNGVLFGNSAQVNQVSVTVPITAIGSGAAQVMTSNSTQATSPYDNYAVCSPPQQVYVGAAYQRSNANNGPATAVLQVTSPPNLVNATGETIPFSQIRWTVSTVGTVDTTPGVIPAGTFTGGTQALAVVSANRFVENCHTFIYANQVAPAAGTYNGQVTYTLSAP